MPLLLPVVQRVVRQVLDVHGACVANGAFFQDWRAVCRRRNLAACCVNGRPHFPFDRRLCTGPACLLASARPGKGGRCRDGSTGNVGTGAMGGWRCMASLGCAQPAASRRVKQARHVGGLVNSLFRHDQPLRLSRATPLHRAMKAVRAAIDRNCRRVAGVAIKSTKITARITNASTVR